MKPGNNRRDQTETIEPTRKKKVFAAVCPRNPAHLSTRVYNTQGRVRYCCCDDCGESWKQTGPAASEPKPAEEEAPQIDE